MSHATGPTCIPSADGHCSICSDDATIARVIAIDRIAGTADVTSDGCTTTVGIDLLDGVALGALVLVHMGFAISFVSDGAVSNER